MDERTRRHRAAKRAFLDAYKAVQGCCDCGATERLQFDHRGPKAFKLGSNVSLSWRRLLAEAAQCEVRCASCHTRRHHQDEPGRRAGRGIPKPRRKAALA